MANHMVVSSDVYVCVLVSMAVLVQMLNVISLIEYLLNEWWLFETQSLLCFNKVGFDCEPTLRELWSRFPNIVFKAIFVIQIDFLLFYTFIARLQRLDTYIKFNLLLNRRLIESDRQSIAWIALNCKQWCIGG